MISVYFVALALVMRLASGELDFEETIRRTVIAGYDEYSDYQVNITDYVKTDKSPLTFAPGMVSQLCLKCICLRESGCKNVGCRMDVGSLSCGYFQIKLPYWIDCGKPGRDWKSCSADVNCASQCVQNYMKRYATHYRCHMDCEGFAREHNGGPNGCHNPNTLAYWNALKRIPGCEHVTL